MPVYLARFGALGPVKIGSTDWVLRRVEQIGSRLWDDLHVLRVLDGSAPEERELHQRFAHLRIRYEWFHYHPDMMGDLGLADITLAGSLPEIGSHVRHDKERCAISNTWRQWMIDTRTDARALASLVGVSVGTIGDWLKYGTVPNYAIREKVVRLCPEFGPLYYAAKCARSEALRKSRKAA